MAKSPPKSFNYERFMLVLFPLITLSLFFLAILGLWVLNVLILPRLVN